MRTFFRFFAATLCAVALLTACGREPEPAKPPEPAARHVGDAGHAMPRTAAPEGAKVFFVTLANGAVVPGTFTVEFGVEGISVVRAGDDSPASGHHHLLIDTGLPEPGLPIPADANHVHFGDGSSSTELTLPAGEHTLQLLLGDHLHIPHDPPVYSDRITITVE